MKKNDETYLLFLNNRNMVYINYENINTTYGEIRFTIDNNFRTLWEGLLNPQLKTENGIFGLGKINSEAVLQTFERCCLKGYKIVLIRGKRAMCHLYYGGSGKVLLSQIQGNEGVREFGESYRDFNLEIGNLSKKADAIQITVDRSQGYIPYVRPLEINYHAPIHESRIQIMIYSEKEWITPIPNDLNINLENAHYRISFRTENFKKMPHDIESDIHGGSHRIYRWTNQILNRSRIEIFYEEK